VGWVQEKRLHLAKEDPNGFQTVDFSYQNENYQIKESVFAVTLF
jgi:hypothetical protein